MDVYWMSGRGLERRRAEDLPGLLARDEGYVWVDIPECDEPALSLLTETFGFHPLAVRDCLERTHIPKVHAYADHLFTIVHAPEAGEAGHVHLLELDQFIGPRYLVTVHGPLGVGVPIDAALRETRAVLARIEAGRFRPGSPFDLSYAIVSAMARRMEEYVKTVASRIAGLERRAMTDDLARPEPLIEEMFILRHEMITIVTMAAQSEEMYARVANLPRVPTEARAWFEDLNNQFHAVSRLGEGEERFLEGVVDFYQTRVATELNLFVKRLTSVGAILVSATLIAGVYGMNFRHMPELDWKLGYPIAMGMMVVVALLLAWFFRRKHWL
jgi:magnesium transporter